MLFRDIKGLVLKDFKLIDLFIFKSLNSHVSLINEVGFYISNSGGKRLRPLLLLLMSKVCGYKGNLHIPLSVVIEFIHTSTLLHDDVVDSSLNRRGNLTVNTCWGNQIAVLVGDFLYSKAFQIMVRSGDLEVLRLLSNSAIKIAELDKRRNTSKSPDLTII
jgi:octaprenyl-diphosphate synthase